MEESPLPKTFNDSDKKIFESNGGYKALDTLAQHAIFTQAPALHHTAGFLSRQQAVQAASLVNIGGCASLSDSSAWLELEREALQHADRTIMALLQYEDTDRVTKTMHADVDLGEKTRSGTNMITLDASKSHVSREWKAKFMKLLAHVNFDGARNAMFNGEAINTTENRSVLHIALREMDDSAVIKDASGNDVMPKVREVREKMRVFTDKVRSGEWKGHTGKAVKHVVNIGIGGSDLGPMMATEALKPYGKDGMTMHFVSNVDGAHMDLTLKKVELEETLFIVASKTFTTQETLQNAKIARDALVKHYGGEEKGASAVAKHFVAVSTNSEKVSQFGIDTANMFEFWDWVGGRYSMWSAIGLSIAIYIGFDNFKEMLTGANLMDKHFKTAAPEENLPVMLAMNGVYYGNFRGCEAHAVLPYSQVLHRFPAYLQQLDMESNGKSVCKTGTCVGVDVHTGPLIFGEPGTNGQHAFYQLIHQGTRMIPCDFIGTFETHSPIANMESHKMLMANMIAQSEALCVGKSLSQASTELIEQKNMSQARKEMLTAHKVFAGNRPSNVIMMRLLTPRAFGALVAAYEHKVFTQGTIWGINSFDQWGVELGKALTNNLLPEMVPGAAGRGHDPSTNHLLSAFNATLPATQ